MPPIDPMPAIAFCKLTEYCDSFISGFTLWYSVLYAISPLKRTTLLPHSIQYPGSVIIVPVLWLEELIVSGQPYSLPTT